MRPRRITRVVGIWGIGVGGLIAVGCGGTSRPNATQPPSPYQYVAPPSRADGIAVANAATLGIDTTRIAQLVRPYLEGMRGRTTSLLVMKDGQLIIEEYFSGWKRQQRHGVQSISKSITSLLVGYAIAQGFIASVDDPIGKYLPRYQQLLTGGKEKITIRDLLTMTSGLDWDESSRPYGDAANTRTQQMNSRDVVEFVLSRRLVAPPGETWQYSGGATTVLGEILKNATGLAPERLVERAFAGMLSPDEIRPGFERDHRLNAAGGFMVTPRGMAKIGQMILQRGAWNGRAIFDPRWIEESTVAPIAANRIGYGYSWWRMAFRVDGRMVEAVEGRGYGGQHIWAFPELRIVIVVTATNFGRTTPPDTVVEAGVMRALGHDVGATAPTAIDSALAFPPREVAWVEIRSDTSDAIGVRRFAVDTARARRLDDGSYLVWMRTTTTKPGLEGTQPYNRLISRLIFRCSSQTDARFKLVSVTAFLDDGPIVFQRGAGMSSALAQPWGPALLSGPDATMFRLACARVAR